MSGLEQSEGPIRPAFTHEEVFDDGKGNYQYDIPPGKREQLEGLDRGEIAYTPIHVLQRKDQDLSKITAAIETAVSKIVPGAKIEIQENAPIENSEMHTAFIRYRVTKVA